jgi:hypothetical protein
MNEQTGFPICAEAAWHTKIGQVAYKLWEYKAVSSYGKSTVVIITNWVFIIWNCNFLWTVP